MARTGQWPTASLSFAPTSQSVPASESQKCFPVTWDPYLEWTYLHLPTPTSHIRSHRGPSLCPCSPACPCISAKCRCWWLPLAAAHLSKWLLYSLGDSLCGCPHHLCSTLSNCSRTSQPLPSLPTLSSQSPSVAQNSQRQPCQPPHHYPSTMRVVRRMVSCVVVTTISLCHSMDLISPHLKLQVLSCYSNISNPLTSLYPQTLSSLCHLHLSTGWKKPGNFYYR